MPFEIVRNDIANMRVDAIVNTANPNPVVGYGVDTGIHQKAGPELLEARKKIGNIRVGDAAITPGFFLPARYVIHAVGPVWRGGFLGEARLLRRCYTRSLKLAEEYGCSSVAFPLISAGNHGFPKEKALKIAMEAIQDFLMDSEMQVFLVVFSRDAFRLSEKLFRGISSFIDEHYVQEKNFQQYGVTDKCDVRGLQQSMTIRQQMAQAEAMLLEEDTDWEEFPPCPSTLPLWEAEEFRESAPKRRKTPRKENIYDGASAPRHTAQAKPTLAELLAQTDSGFSETLLKLIDQKGKKDAEIYKKANLSKQHFSKIRSNPDYKPSKPTAIALALALELDLEATKDLISRAGYALTNSSKFDLIIQYFIAQGNYNVVEINIALYEFDQVLLGK